MASPPEARRERAHGAVAIGVRVGSFAHVGAVQGLGVRARLDFECIEGAVAGGYGRRGGRARGGSLVVCPPFPLPGPTAAGGGGLDAVLETHVFGEGV